MDIDVLVALAGAPGHGDVDARALGRSEVVEVGGRAVGEDGAIPAGQNGGHEAPPGGEQFRRDQRIDAVVDAVQKPALGPGVHRSGAEAESAKLQQRKHSVLAPHEPRVVSLVGKPTV
jgi:hypothetical protein